MISKECISDLELDKVLSILKGYCRSLDGKNLCDKIHPFFNFQALENELYATYEYFSNISSGSNPPSTSFDSIWEELKFLELESSYLQPEALSKIRFVSNLCNEFLDYFDKFKEFFPIIIERLSDVYTTNQIINPINKILDPNGEIKSDASEKLRTIRQSITKIQSNIDKEFIKELSRCRNEGFLSDIGESVIDHKRVLAVDPTHRKKVPGTFLGTSKMGSIIFIEPLCTAKLNSELEDLILAENQEIISLLKITSSAIRPFTEFLQRCSKALSMLDLINAKSAYAIEIGASLPKIEKFGETHLIDATHPLLIHRNKIEKKQSVAQTIKLDVDSRIVIISGPNAGGKSISLKTVGLLQLMLQCGLLVPVKNGSSMCFFKSIISEIGDKQSIENHLSTYSAKLENMAVFLENADKNTLFLIDEFGSGSDPDLGGALAEVFLEEFWKKGSYGVITTHYGNIKLLAENLKGISNASMLFDEKTLKPTYKLILGQAGSSFTFEVAQNSGIKKELIERAKNKVDKGKLNLEKTIIKIQKQKHIAETASDNIKKSEEELRKSSQELKTNNEKLKTKLLNYQMLYDVNLKQIQIGRKIQQLAELYFFKKQNKAQLSDNIMKIISLENAKRNEKAALDKLAENQNKKQEQIKLKELEKIQKQESKKIIEIEKQIEEELKPIREENNEILEKIKQEKLQTKTPKNYIFKTGDKVRLKDSFACGQIEKIEKENALVKYEFFTIKVAIKDLELVQASKLFI